MVFSFVSLSVSTALHRVRTSTPRYRRCPAHSSCCSASTAPTRRMIESRFGNIQTTLVRRRISRLSRSLGLLNQSCRHIFLGKLVKAKMSAQAACRCCATAGSLCSKVSRTRSN